MLCVLRYLVTVQIRVLVLVLVLVLVQVQVPVQIRVLVPVLSMSLVRSPLKDRAANHLTEPQYHPLKCMWFTLQATHLAAFACGCRSFACC